MNEDGRVNELGHLRELAQNILGEARDMLGSEDEATLWCLVGLIERRRYHYVNAPERMILEDERMDEVPARIALDDEVLSLARPLIEQCEDYRLSSFLPELERLSAS